MAITPTPTWTQGDKPTSSVQIRDFYSGKVSVDNSEYDPDTRKYVFGFSAAGLLIRNSGGGELTFQWLHNEGEDFDNGTVPAGGEFPIHFAANKTGVLIRVDSGPTSGVEIIAWG